jgi:hypothetical protein
MMHSIGTTHQFEEIIYCQQSTVTTGKLFPSELDSYWKNCKFISAIKSGSFPGVWQKKSAATYGMHP